MSAKPCPCESGFAYVHCCAPYHAGLQPAFTALALMRSRYSAYALGLADYLMKTTHPENESYSPHVKAWRKELQAYCKQTKFTGLEILKDEPGELESFVTFQAGFIQNKQKYLLQERSRFLKVETQWLYHSGFPTLSN